MATSVTAFDAKNALGRLLDRVQSGEEITITRHGEPVARLVPLSGQGHNEATAALEAFKVVRRSLAKRRTKLSRADVRRFASEGRR